jgi:signal transduction histidine kinase
MRIRQVYTNFVTNAVKYTHQGHIKVGYRKEWREENGESREGLFLFCEDTGDGVPKEVQDKLFERFFKLNDYIQGTGLGLSICKAIANACQGFIGMESDGQGQGSTFWMWIPCNEIKA